MEKEMVEIEEQGGFLEDQEFDDGMHDADETKSPERDEIEAATNKSIASVEVDEIALDLTEEEVKSEATLATSESSDRPTILQETTDFILSIPSFLVDSLIASSAGGRDKLSFTHVPSTEVELARLDEGSTSDESSGEETSEEGSEGSLLEAGEDFLTDSDGSEEIAKLEAGDEQQTRTETAGSSRRDTTNKNFLKCFSATVCAIILIVAVNSIRGLSIWGDPHPMKHDLSYYAAKYDKKPQIPPNRQADCAYTNAVDVSFIVIAPGSVTNSSIILIQKQLDVLASFPWKASEDYETRFLQVPMYLINRGRRFILLTEGSLLSLANLFEISGTAEEYRKRVYEINHTAFIVPSQRFNCGKIIQNDSIPVGLCSMSAQQNQDIARLFPVVLPQGVLVVTCPSIFRIRGYTETPLDGGLDKEMICRLRYMYDIRVKKLDGACGFVDLNIGRQNNAIGELQSSENYTFSNAMCDLLMNGNLLAAFQRISKVVTKNWGFPDVGMFERKYRNRIP
ncbi:hypothetical protein GUITHDRAFT_161131 [Guillardia theta CCMP2712]|uniref:Uncharacterized protein n=1 Tax=Guillardia theta (strain CCMP2712) TaxID=905079 RepID=L1JXP9_GUITC|nr:hypothetical protein GUITHDRAFT_161131 [Guillardia theta CCMP2712]EKX52990.1 hypothetical protein GUITHDRAFT_161131 [Guillardia theta CCMP2712]|eukprot:XP_005839970.1 hypothetical protein GUITHDRAFT_161131 [Guillardia theta CCMP2712]